MRHDFAEEDNFTETMEFGEYLKKKRRLMGMSQADFGYYLGYGQHTVSSWEIGKTSPPFDMAKGIINTLGGEIRILNHETKNISRRY